MFDCDRVVVFQLAKLFADLSSVAELTPLTSPKVGTPQWGGLGPRASPPLLQGSFTSPHAPFHSYILTEPHVVLSFHWCIVGVDVFLPGVFIFSEEKARV